MARKRGPRDKIPISTMQCFIPQLFPFFSPSLLLLLSFSPSLLPSSLLPSLSVTFLLSPITNFLKRHKRMERKRGPRDKTHLFPQLFPFFSPMSFSPSLLPSSLLPSLLSLLSPITNYLKRHKRMERKRGPRDKTHLFPQCSALFHNYFLSSLLSPSLLPSSLLPFLLSLLPLSLIFLKRHKRMERKRGPRDKTHLFP
jgi:hypothetical protein